MLYPISENTNCTKADDAHPSIVEIKNNHPDLALENISFSEIDEEFVGKRINKINVKKATGIDGISPKLLHFVKPVITKIVNLAITSSTFSARIKGAQVAPVHKKNNVLEAGNDRPVSVLPAISKLFGNSLEIQLVKYFDKIFSPFLAAFRSGFGCQSTLLIVIEDWKKALDKNEYLTAILMDVSKAFDCLPHDLLLMKLKAYDLSQSALEMLNITWGILLYK